MWRWLSRWRSDRGGQHAEAGVLMATLVALAGAVTVGSVPQLSTAVSDQWVCHISDRGNERCGGETSKGEAPAGKQFTAETFGASSTAISADYEDPADSHLPVRVEEGTRQVDFDGYPGEVSTCFRGGSDQLCVGTNGLLYECRDTGEPVSGQRYATKLDCSLSITADTPLICTDEGLSPGTDTCLGAIGDVYHCTNLDAKGTRVCRSADNDADTAPSLLESCGRQINRDGTAACLGDNGTLYTCSKVLTAGSQTPCDDGTRDIDPKSVDDCVDIVSHSSGTTAEDVSSGRVQRCTYTPKDCDVEPRVPGTNYGCEPVSVRCLVQLPGDVDPRTRGGQVTRKTYQHCQSLGQVVEDGSSLQTACVVEQKGACEEAVTTNVSRAPDDLVTARAGDQTLAVEPDATATIDVDGVPTTMDVAELTTYCTSHENECAGTLDETTAATNTGIADYFEGLGVCTTDCDDFVTELGAAFGPSTATSGGPGRGLRGSSVDNGINLVGVYSFAAAVGAGLVNNYVPGINVSTHVYTVLITITAGAYLTNGIRKDLRRGDDGAHAQALAVGIIAAKKIKGGVGTALRAAKSGGATAADWAGKRAAATGGAIARGGKAAQKAIVDHIRQMKDAMARARASGATSAGDIETGGTG